MADNVEETNSGVKKKGEWKEIAEFSEEVEEAVKDAADEQSVKEFEEWRPKEEEAENNMKRKTVEKALVKKKIATKGKEDFKEASEKALEATKKVTTGQNPSKEINQASETAMRPFAATVLGAFRRFETLVYSKIILRGKRYYLDTEELSADMKSNRSGEYELDVNVNSDKSRRKLKEKFKNA
ncbi:DUF5828 family protein [Candidatus Nanohalococcus occultus]|uniref:DUF5828 family protein n=1 Tax=Candidatus Nanohalococcus occultus TaxID=2978047 RepID=UPI0039E00D64